MLFPVRQTFRALTACVLVAVFAVPPSLLAQIHIVSRADLQRETLAATQARQHNLETVRQFLSSQAAQKLVKSAHGHCAGQNGSFDLERPGTGPPCLEG